MAKPGFKPQSLQAVLTLPSPAGKWSPGPQVGEESEAFAVGAELKEVAKNSGIEIHNILMQYFKRSKARQKNIHNEQNIKIINKDRI